MDSLYKSQNTHQNSIQDFHKRNYVKSQLKSKHSKKQRNKTTKKQVCSDSTNERYGDEIHQDSSYHRRIIDRKKMSTRGHSIKLSRVGKRFEFILKTENEKRMLLMRIT